MMPVTHHQATAVCASVMLIAFDVFLHLPLDGRLKRPPGSIAQDVINDRRSCRGNRIGCQTNLKCVTVHEAYPFCPAWDAGEPLITIHRRYAAFIHMPAIHDFRL